MRTLKKSLALVLALVMVLGLGVVGASADDVYDSFTDTDEVGAAYVEAVGVLTGLGVVEGMSDTTPVISPQSTYTRAQAAKIIAVLLLGNDGAEALKCVEAPFDDVQPNQWFAGYVAYCAEKGIIDGMTATTFEPDGTLTGYQWAKMLLAAVGFGKNGEFVGGTWSLNTATVGTQSGLFTGDLDAADHTPIRREQAMLFAFNALTKLRQVTYSANSNNYVYGIRGYFFADNTGKTLGQSTFDLNSVEGVIVDNEGMGASATYIDNVNYGGKPWQQETVKVKANTELDEMYHAVRCWYVEGSKANTGVYTYDLAKVTTTTCPAKATTGAMKIGAGHLYETYVVDNSALEDADSFTVELYADTAKVGPKSTVQDTTVIGTTAALNANIKTDMTDIAEGDTVVYVRAQSVKEYPSTATAYAYYVYPVTATSGVTTKVDADGTVTLRDGTVLKQSNLSNVKWPYVGVSDSYTFVLDTHGDWISATMSKNLVYYTGAYTRTFGAYVGEETYQIQVVSTDDGTISTVPVLGSWSSFWGDDGDDNLFGINEAEAGYYVLGEPTKDGFYRPIAWLTASGAERIDVAGKEYVANTGSLSVTSTKLDGMDFAPAEVQFIVATNNGSALSVNTYNGITELLANIGDAATTSAVLRNAAVTFETTEYGNENVLKVFVPMFDVRSTFVFVPFTVDAGAYDGRYEVGYGAVAYVYGDNAYLNGSSEYFPIVYRAPAAIERGFYSYEIDANGFVDLTPANPTEWNYEDEDIGRRGSTLYQLSDDGFEYEFASNVVVFDVRTGVANKVVDPITTLEQLASKEPSLQLAYTFNAERDIAVVYIVEWNLGKVATTIDDTLDLSFTNTKTADKDEVFFENDDVRLYGEDVDALPTGTKVDIAVTGGDATTGEVKELPATDNGEYEKYIEVDFRKAIGYGDTFTVLEITGVTYDVTIVNANEDLTAIYRYADDERIVVTDKETVKNVPVGTKFDIGWYGEDVAAGIEATGTYSTKGTNGEATSYTIEGEFNSFHCLWSGKTVTPGNVVTLNNDVTAEYTITLGDSNDSTAAKDYNFPGDSKEDTLVVTGVPGQAITFKVQKSDSFTDTQAGNLKFTVYTAGTVLTSAETVATSGADRTFTFTYTPVANEFYLGNTTYSAEVEAPNA